MKQFKKRLILPLLLVAAVSPMAWGQTGVKEITVTIDGVNKNLKWATCNVGAEKPWD